jgi:hypothetical protein
VATAKGKPLTGKNNALNFGKVRISAKSPGPQRTIRVTNTGDAPVALQLGKLPKGITLLDPLTPLLMPGESDTFTLQMSRKTPAAHVRRLLQINTDDPRRPRVALRISGVVNT